MSLARSGAARARQTLARSDGIGAYPAVERRRDVDELIAVAGGSDDAPAPLELDFKVGGRETNRGVGPDGKVYTYDARYADIVPDQRIVYSYEMYQDGRRVSMSIGTVELESEGGATRLIYTEQGAFLDGLDSPADREHGTRELLDALGGVLQRAPARA